MLFKYIHNNYYQSKIVITFSIVTILLVALLAKVSYDFIYDFYLDQLSENVKSNTLLTIGQIDPEYITALEEGILTESTKNYFSKLLTTGNFENIYSELFLFDDEFRVIVHSDPNKLTRIPEPRLLINETEIFRMYANSVEISLPFKGNDDKWYLWGFYRFSSEYWLAVRANAEKFQRIDDLSYIIWSFGLGGVVFSILLGLFIARSITKPINKLVKFSTGIGRGILNESPPKIKKGELKILSDALILMRNNIAENQKEKEKILAQIAHEIRNPLGGIELLTSLIYESVDNESKSKEYSEKIIKEIKGLKELITSYLNFSRPTPAMPEEINLSEIADETISFLRTDINKFNIVIKKNLELQKIIFDKIHIRNILLNLLKNSIESIKENGEIVISSLRIHNKDTVKITDNGGGIPKDILDKIFEPFFTTKKNGTGLGLASCKKFCEENSAMLVAENLKQGCSFTIIIENENE